MAVRSRGSGWTRTCASPPSTRESLRGFELTAFEAIFDLPLGIHHRLGIAGAITSLGAEFFPRDEGAAPGTPGKPELVFRAGRLRAFYRFSTPRSPSRWG